MFFGGREGRIRLQTSPFQSPTPDLRATIWEMFFFAETDRAEHFQNHLKQTSLGPNQHSDLKQNSHETLFPHCVFSQKVHLLRKSYLEILTLQIIHCMYEP